MATDKAARTAVEAVIPVSGHCTLEMVCVNMLLLSGWEAVEDIDRKGGASSPFKYSFHVRSAEACTMSMLTRMTKFWNGMIGDSNWPR